MTISCIAVDDEPLSLSLLCSYIEQTPFLALAGRYSNGVAALKAIHENKPDIVFMDIRMPDLSGIDLALIMATERNKNELRVIFTTAHDQYAVESYRFDALDYLLKPFSYVDFSRAAQKARDYFDFINHKSMVYPTKPFEVTGKEYLYVKADHHLVKIDVSEVLYIEGLKDYVKIFLVNEAKPIITLTSLKNLEEKLTGKGFLRLHRSFIVSTEKIRAVTKNSLQIGQTKIPVTEQYKDVFKQVVSKWIV
jgi:DNA-binding LytR/AlgR family response regulator